LIGRLFPPWLLVLLVTAGFAVLAWSAVEQYRSRGGDDEVAYRALVDGLYANHRLPGPNENAEFALPPAVPSIGVALTWAFNPVRPDRASPVLQSLPRLLRRLVWLALVLVGGLLVACSRRLEPRWLIGVGLWLAALAWAWAYVDAATDNEALLPIVLVDYVSAVALVPITALLAHEVWPERRWAPAVGAVGATLLPSVFAAGLYFHPDPPFAAIAAGAALLVVRALRTGLSAWGGVAAGLALAAAALTRQSGALVAILLLGSALVVARRRAVPYVVAAAAVLVIAVGPWWIHQYHVYDDPLRANLNRPGYMIDREPRSFYVSFPVALVTHPYHYSFQYALLPRFHAYLWSDWGGNYHDWDDPKPHARTLASIQSVLGLGGDALVLVGLAAFGVPASLRSLRRRGDPRDGVYTVLTAFFVLTWAAYIVELIRFPQKGGDPIKAHYLLFLAPAAIVFAIASGSWLVSRGGWRRALLVAWVAVYAVSWALTIETAF
jgi:4-amino-4-deoxy-L-arabinose transferase-like glycosyltransferase